METPAATHPDASSSAPPPPPPSAVHAVTVGPGGPRRPGVQTLALIGFCALCGTAAEMFMKIGADQAAEGAMPGGNSWLAYLGLTSRWVWLSIAFTLASFGGWTLTMREVPLSVAFPLANVVHILIPLSSWWFLGESISARRWAGIALVMAGLVVVAKPYTAINARL